MAGRSDRIALYGLLVLTLFRLVMAGWMPVTPDEAYYWTWSRHLQPSYLDHPPMVALWIWLGTAVFGDTAFGIRVLGPLAAAVGTVLVVKACQILMRYRGEPTQQAVSLSLIAGILLNAMLAVATGTLLMTPDTPLLFFMAVFLWAAACLLYSQRPTWWLVIGLCAGLGFDSKYTMVLPVAGLGLWCLCSIAGRRSLLTPWPWMGVGLAGLLSLPVVWWNAHHGWASFIRQGGRTGEWHPTKAFGYFGELLGGQIGLLTPGIFLLAVMACVRAMRRRDAVDGLLLCLIGVPCLVFAQHALGDRVQPNWPVIVYPALAILIAISGVKGWKAASALGYGLSILAILQAATGLLPLNRHFDVSLRQGGGWDEFARNIATRAHGASVVLSDEYGLASELAFHLEGESVAGAEPRWELFDFPQAECPEGWALLVHNARRSFTPGTPWGEITQPMGEIVRERGGREAERYGLYRVACPLSRVPAAWLRMLPSPRSK